MPNTGRPSRDCHLCRKRRVKCDLARPACQRCIKYGTECPGYRDQQELVFRNADPTAVRKRKKRTSQSPGVSGSPSSAASGTAYPTPVLSPNGDFMFTSSTDVVLAKGVNCNAAAPLTRPVFQHWTSHSVPIVLNVYSNLDFIQDIYSGYNNDGPLIWAAHLFSRTYVTNLRYPTAISRDAHEETQRELGTYLVKTLNSVNKALGTPEGAFRDDVLATIWLLSNYELLIGSLNRTETLSPWHLHARGLYSILKIRGVAPLHTVKGRMMFWPAYSMVQIQSLINNTECPPESQEWFDAIAQSLSPGEGLGLHVSLFMIKICSVQARIFSFFRRRDFSGASREYNDLLAQMKAAIHEIEDWMESNPVGNHMLEIYVISLYQSAIVKGFNAVKLLINFLTHYPLCSIPLQQLTADRDYCIEIAQTSAQGIIETVPRILGPLAAKGKDKSPKTVFDALRIIWPLICVYVMDICRPEQRLTASEYLFYIGRELGIRQGLNTYSTKLTLPPEARVPFGEHEEL
ncbi:hypothetical protein M441DRAFT_61589 [Trichoderma asperellum CBS 433.97]|uniref:Zn(2)-C6 fungal-type domain-containing protein n=1 Tax=Trichoderma asperellum (strain ATCC 204424 / CBS 433.97 / NBRC 101777) TaxID=1042311 RepID=A0A2T3YWD1_TRIA4|nr:hypothetical protein M441DRAFT_61589 [Trichoderma asperellum CBS 433.97]PTB36869.1 hypothetical protein M441DRAFT_61589 [Trichoderma asperellum CBS 433.97]WVH32760.1 zinc finger protein [Trichoderma asperellum]